MEFFATNAPDTPDWILNSFLVRFLVVECIWDHFVTACNSVQNGLKWCKYCKSSCHEVGSEFFETIAPDPRHWTQNSCFVAFCSVRVHLGPFRYFMILGSKQDELLQLMQKFVPQSPFRSFASNPPDPLHLALNSCFGAFS